jgi:2-polyprenyl-6-methoxyphenol hydroxylase-like FAD-dependent oxidoreductase
VHAAADAGAEVREGFTVDEVLIEDGTVIGVRGKAAAGATVTEHASVVIGADGRNSSVAKAVNPEQYNEKPAVSPAFYSYWSGIGSSGFEVAIRDRCGMASFPTHDNLALVIVGLPENDFNAARSDVEGTFLRTVDLAAALGDRVRSGQRERFTPPATSRATSASLTTGWPSGDAGCHLHPITASHRFLDANVSPTH